MKLKNLFLIVAFLLSFNAWSQDAVGYLKKSDEVSHNPKMRGLQDLVFDIVNPQLTKQLNDQMIFGHLNEVSFRIYWTANPERVAVEVNGMPEGFREIKEELKAMMIGRLESVIPIPLEKKLQGYQFKLAANKLRTVSAVDASHQRPIPEYELVFDVDGKLLSMTAKKPIGTVTSQFTWLKAPWSEPRFYTSQAVTKAEEGPQTTVIESSIAWQTVTGIGVPSSIRTKTTQTLRQPGGGKPIERSFEETLNFKNYKVNAGEALKWFLGHGTAP